MAEPNGEFILLVEFRERVSDLTLLCARRQWEGESFKRI